MQGKPDKDLIEIGLELCNTSLNRFVTWWRIYAPLHEHLPSENIHVACRIGWYVVVERILVDGVDVNLRTHYSGICPLHFAARSDRNYAVVKLLLDRGADINAEERMRRRPLQIAAACGAIRVGELLLDNGADVNAAGDLGTALYEACEAGDEGMVQLLVERRAKVNLGDSGNGDMHFPLVIASWLGYVMIAQHLINHGADVNVVDSSFGTALTAACSKGYEAIVRLLLQNGADIEATGGTGRFTALLKACCGEYESIVRLLLDAGAEASRPSFLRRDDHFPSRAFEISPLHSAAWNDTVKVAQLLIDYGADVNAQSDQIGTPLVLAAYKGNYSMVEFLLDNGADVLATCDYFVNALVAAADGTHEDVIQLLLSHGARFCKSDWEGLRDWDCEGYLLKLDSIYEQVKGEDMQKTIEVLLAAKGLTSYYAGKTWVIFFSI